ncbi:MAG: hypothetical protein RR397_03145 [Odoribacter sp.]
MKTRGYQLLVQVLLLIVISMIVTYTCMYWAELMDIFSNAVKNSIIQFNLGF